MIKITTDSTCVLPAELLEQHNITVLPLGIVKAGKLYQDGVNICTADIAAHVDAGGEITTTNAVNVADYETVFRRETERYDAVIHINIGMGFSCCHQNAKLAAEEVPEVYVVDSSNLSMGHGMVVLAAAEAAEAGGAQVVAQDLGRPERAPERRGEDGAGGDTVLREPARRAMGLLQPRSVKGESHRPCTRCCRLNSVCPCRTR